MRGFVASRQFAAGFLGTLALLALAAVALSGCSDRPEFAEARQAAAATLPYPSSAEFRSVRFGTGGIVCGEMDGTGLDGRKTGYRRFSWRRETGVVIEGGDSPTGNRELDMNSARVTDALVTIGCE